MSKIRRERQREKLLEFVLHPFNTFQAINNYRYSTDKEIAKKRQEKNANHIRNANTYLDRHFKFLYDSNRVNLYATYGEIDYDPIMQQVCKAYATSCTLPNYEAKREEAGRAIWCYSKNKDVQKINNDFFTRTVIDLKAPAIIRNMFLNGDTFVMIPGVRGQGITNFEGYEPWHVAMVHDGMNNVIGYSQADEKGEPISVSQTVEPHYRFIHFAMPQTYRSDIYNQRSSLFYSMRKPWLDSQWMWDKVVIDRLRRQNRMLILLDVGGMSSDESFEMTEEWRNRLYQEQYFSPSEGLTQTPMPWGEQRDIILPVGQDSNTQFSQMPATGSDPYDDLNLSLRRLFGGLGFPPARLGLDLGGTYDPSTMLVKQDVAFAQNCMNPQRAFLMGMIRACKINMAYMGIDPNSSENEFFLSMTPVDTFLEIERKELLAMRFDLVDRALSMGQDNEWDRKVWDRHVLTEYGNFPEDMVELLLKVKEEQETATEGEFADSLENDSRYNELNDAMEEYPKAAEALTFADHGCSMTKSTFAPVRHLPPCDLSESKTNSVVELEKLKLKVNTKLDAGKVLNFCDDAYQKELKERFDLRRDSFKRAVTCQG